MANQKVTSRVYLSNGAVLADADILPPSGLVSIANGSGLRLSAYGQGWNGGRPLAHASIAIGSGTVTSALLDGGYMSVMGFAARAEHTTVTNNGWQDVGFYENGNYNNGLATGTILRNGGKQFIHAGLGTSGVASATQVSAGGTQVLLSSGAKAYETEVFSGGRVTVSNGALLSGATIHSGGVVSAAFGGHINGNVAVSGLLANGIVDGGGLVQIFSGGTLNGPTTVASGGSVQVNNGGRLIGAIDLTSEGRASIATDAGGIVNLAYGNYSQVTFTGSGNFNTQVTNFNGNSAFSDRILLRDIPRSNIVGVSYPDADHIRFLMKDGTSIVLNIVGVRNYGYDLSDDPSGGTLFAVCYLEGTMIDTPDGERPIQTLRIGDEIYVYRDGVREVRAISGCGSKKVKHAPNDNVERHLVCFKKDSLEPLSPHTDLFVTPEHCIFIDGYFVPARMLVNGVSIFHDTEKKEYTYYHIETAEHSVISANGAFSESYLNTGNLTEFDNFASSGSDKKTICAPHAVARLNTTREFVEPIWARLAKDIKRGNYDHQCVRSEEKLYLETDEGKKILPCRVKSNKYMFFIPEGVDLIYICSDSMVPSSTIGPYVDDRRKLGALISDIHLFGAQGGAQIDVNNFLVHARGWHDSDSRAGRWTKGRAVLPFPYFDFPGEVRILAVDVMSLAADMK